MSLIVSAPKGGNFQPVPDGTYLGVCSMIVDLGAMYSERYDKTQRKVMIAWELPAETIEVNGKTERRTVSSRYTATLGSQGNLRRDLITWRGRDFTEDELAGFELKNILGKSCLLTITNTKGSDGKNYTNVSGVARLMKGMAAAELEKEPLLFDLDTASLDDVDALPNWIGDQIKKSVTYQQMLEKEKEMEADPVPATTFTDLDDDEGDLPF